jgi:hypothetical protein
MAVTPGVASAFGATLQDNGNPIDLPPNSQWKFSTDDPTDVIQNQSQDGSVILVTVNPPAGSTRNTLTVTADTTDPNGDDVSGSVTTDITPGVTHTYSVNVSQVFAQQLQRRR